MIDRPAFLADAQKLLAKLEKDLRARCDDMPEVGQAVAAEYRRAKDAGRTGQTLEEWRADAITQQAAAWVLSCVFVRFLEDNRLMDPPKLAGPGDRLNRARDEHEEEFILVRTLEPAVETFGLDKVRLIDPACGSGHFLLGAFGRLLDHWTRREPATPRRELVQRALNSVHGVDLNPYAVAIARFRLLLAAWQACGITSLANAPAFRLNLACGDSLLHGSTKAVQGSLGFAGLDHHYQPENAAELERLLRPGTYHAVVANPPYITPKDRGLNEKYRERYSACYKLYSLAVPFMQRIFDLACEGGFTGQITAKSFPKREFGKKLIQDFFPTIDLTHVIDTSGAYIPGHGTPTVVLFGRNRPPVASTVRTVMGIRGEPSTPEDPAHGHVWSTIVVQVDQPGSKSDFVSVADSPRENFHRHPWSIGGGGAAELKEQLDEAATRPLSTLTNDIGFVCITKADEVFAQPGEMFRRYRCEREKIQPFGIGEEVRDWSVAPGEFVIFPYDAGIRTVDLSWIPQIHSFMWLYRVELENRKVFGGQSYREVGKPWHEYGQIPVERAKIHSSLVFGSVATHNHFVLDRGGKVFKQSAPVIKLSTTSTEDEHLALLGLLNSSTGCFWMKQVFQTKGSSGIGRGVYDEAWEKHYDIDGTKLKQFPLPAERPLDLARSLNALARQLAEQQPARVLERWQEDLTQRRKDAKDLLGGFASLREAYDRTRRQMIALQEDLDWQCYRLYGLVDDDLCGFAPLRELSLGQRPFEIILARKIRDEGLQTTWFARHGSTPTPDTDDPLTLRRIAVIESNPQIALIEQPEYKRRWSDTSWEEKVSAALHAWLLGRLESCFDFDGRMQDLTQSRKAAKQEEPLGVFASMREVSLYSIAKVADIGGRDLAFQTVAELYRSRPDFDVVKLVTELVESDSVPLLPVLRYKPSGLDKRRAWERTWDLQRQEDAIDRRTARKGLGVNDGGWKAATDDGKSPLNPAQANMLKKEKVGPIPPPPKYKPADFQGSTYWRLRGSLDVPKERWVSFPHCQGPDGLPLIAWAGYDHLQLAKAIAAHYVHVQEQEGGREDPRLAPLLAGLIELLPWLKQWHNEIDPEFNMGMGDYFEGFVQDEARLRGRTMEEVRAWQAPAKKTSRKAARTRSKKEE